MYHIELAQLFFSLPYIYPPIWQYGMVAETDKELAKTKSNKGVEGGMDDMVRRWSLQLPRSQVLSLFFQYVNKRRRRGAGHVLWSFFLLFYFLFFVGWSLMHLPLFKTCPMPSCMINFVIQAQTNGQKEREQEKEQEKHDKVEAKSTRDQKKISITR